MFTLHWWQLFGHFQCIPLSRSLSHIYILFQKKCSFSEMLSQLCLQEFFTFYYVFYIRTASSFCYSCSHAFTTNRLIKPNLYEHEAQCFEIYYALRRLGQTKTPQTRNVKRIISETPRYEYVPKNICRIFFLLHCLQQHFCILENRF